MDWSIRLAAPADAPGVQAIYAPIVRDTVISFEYDPPTVEEIARRIAATLSDLPYLVAAHGAHVLGYAYAGHHRTRAAYQWSVETSVYVHPDVRGRGIGRALYERLFAVLALLGYRNLYAGITLPNDASVALHEAVGFQHLGTYDHVGYKHGAWHPVGWWQLFLEAPGGDPPTPPRRLPDLLGRPELESAISGR